MTNMSGMTTIQAKVVLEKLALELPRDLAAATTSKQIDSHLEGWKDDLIRKYQGLHLVKWDIRNEPDGFHIRMVILLDEAVKSISHMIHIPREVPPEVEKTVILPGPEK